MRKLFEYEKSHGDGWKVKAVESSWYRRLKPLDKVDVVEDPELGLCCRFRWVDGSTKLYQTCQNSNVAIGKVLDMSRVMLVTLEKEMEQDIVVADYMDY